MSQTPSNRRREGRNAFIRGCTDDQRDSLNPYQDPYKRDDWTDGWKEAERSAGPAPEPEEPVETPAAVTLHRDYLAFLIYARDYVDPARKHPPRWGALDHSVQEHYRGRADQEARTWSEWEQAVARGRVDRILVDRRAKRERRPY